MSTSYALRPWTEIVHLDRDVERDNLTESVFAIDVGAIAAGDKNVPHVNRDPEAFFRATYLTTDLRRLLEEVLASLSGTQGYNRVLKLRTPFGGGKSHTLAALLHAVRNRKALDVIPESKGLADPGSVDVAVFDGEKFSVQGKDLPDGRHIHTMWGWIAAQLGDGPYAAIEKLDRDRVSPSGDDIQKMLAGGPKLLLLDEVLKYMERAAAVAVLDSTLARQAKDFFQNLTVEVANSPNAVMVYTLQWSARESLDNQALLSELDHMAARVDDLRQPVGDDEIVCVVKRRLLSGEPDSEHATEVAQIFQQVVTKQRRASAVTQFEQDQADAEGTRLRNQIKTNYPFHPATLDVMRGRWASLPDFQRTRGALRFLATCLRAAKKQGPQRPLLGPSDIPLHNADVRNALYKELGLHNEYDAIFTEDLVGQNARVKRIDDRLAKESPALANVQPATRLATAILMYSFGGLRREADGQEEMLPPGISEQELLSICLSPDLDSITAGSVLSDLRNTCVYLHYDGVRYVFKKDPNVTKLIEEAEEQIAAQEAQNQPVRTKIKELLNKKVAGQRSAVVWPEKSADIPDRDPSFLVGYLPLEFTKRSKKDQEAQAKDFFEKYGDGLRKFRNGVGLAIPQTAVVASLERAVKSLLAIEKVETNKAQLRLTKEQTDQLKERRKTEETAIEYSLRELYTAVWLPRIEGGQIAIEKVEAGGRALAATGVHERIMELLIATTRKVFTTLTPRKIVESLRLGEAADAGEQPRNGIKSSEVLESFYSILGLTRLESAEVIKKAIANGVSGDHPEFGYWSGAEPTMGVDGRYQVNVYKVVFHRSFDPSEVDFDTGFLIMPAAMPVEPAPVTPTAAPGAETEKDKPHEGGPTETPAGSVPTQPGLGLRNTVKLSFRANRDQIFKSFPAIANLADAAGEVAIDVTAEKSDGFDESWLRNAVYEPLDEEGLLENSE
jgi:Protein of unknown function (DUF499)